MSDPIPPALSPDQTTKVLEPKPRRAQVAPVEGEGFNSRGTEERMVYAIVFRQCLQRGLDDVMSAELQTPSLVVGRLRN